MSDPDVARGALILSAWDQIALARRCDRQDACRRVRGLERLRVCDCLVAAARRVREQEDAEGSVA